MSEEAPKCVRCGRPVEINRELYQVFERMHWLCFHMEFEHEGDPDASCRDPSCPNWQLEVLRAALKQLGHDPDEIIQEEIRRRYV